METLYAPWREDYFGEKRGGCVFCEIVKNPNLDEKNRVVFRNDELFIVMNKFPYTPGHILIIPFMHADSPELLSKQTWGKMFEIAQDCFKILYDFGASGINMGMNVKASGGAGIPEHLHLHLLPRWSGDTNFLTTIGDARAYGVDFDEVYRKIRTLSKKYL